MIRVLTPEEVIGVLSRERGIKPEILQQSGVNGEIRGMVEELLYRISDWGIDRLGRLCFGASFAEAVSGKIKPGSKLRDLYAKADEKLRK